jgi:hypothetical protein
MVVLESLRHDALTPQLMPNTSRWRRPRACVDHHFSTGNATRYGLFGLLYGLPGGYWPSMLDEQRGSQLFQVLGQQGYDLHLYGSAPLYSPEFDRTAFADVATSCTRARRPGSKARQRIVASLQKDIRASQAAHARGSASSSSIPPMRPTTCPRAIRRWPPDGAGNRLPPSARTTTRPGAEPLPDRRALRRQPDRHAAGRSARTGPGRGHHRAGHR